MAETHEEVVRVVGVGHHSDLIPLKRQLLLVDRIAVIHGSGEWTFRSDDPSLAADLDWLEDRGAVSRVYLSGKVETGVERMEVREVEGKKVLVVVPSPFPGPLFGVLSGSEENWGGVKPLPVRISDLIDAAQDLACRLECQMLRESESVEAVSLHVPRKTLRRGGTVAIALGDVLNVVIKELPHPDDETPLDRILEFRADPVSKGDLLALRRWISKLTKTGLSEIEIVQELEWLLHEYEAHMRLHKMKINKGVVETIVTVVAEVAEDVVKIRWGKLARSLFILSNRKIELLEAEMKAPGREIAYISRTRETFGPRG